MTTLHLRLLLALACVLPSASARADALAVERDPSTILGGAPVDACGWPTAIWVDVCSAILVHPRVVVLASHCIVLGGTPVNASFGESVGAPARQVPIEGCVTYPGWMPTLPGDGNDDIALCELAEPVEDVPIVPILMGCEADALLAGTDVTLVGFGVHDDFGSMGDKYAADTTVQMVGTDAIFLGDATASSCNGDSGGPAYVQLDDGSWRVFGVTSGAAGMTPGCPQTAVYTLIHRYIDWIESTAGIDVTPCHDADGTWNPGEDCTAFPLSPAQGGAAWNAGCDDGERSGPSASCGEPFEPMGGSSSSDGGDSSSSTSDGSSSTGDGVDTSADDGTAAGSSDDAGTTDILTASTTTPGERDGEDGCGCTSAPTTALAPWLGLVALARHRRRRGA